MAKKEEEKEENRKKIEPRTLPSIPKTIIVIVLVALSLVIFIRLLPSGKGDGGKQSSVEYFHRGTGEPQFWFDEADGSLMSRPLEDGQPIKNETTPRSRLTGKPLRLITPEDVKRREDGLRENAKPAGKDVWVVLPGEGSAHYPTEAVVEIIGESISIRYEFSRNPLRIGFMNGRKDGAFYRGEWSDPLYKGTFELYFTDESRTVLMGREWNETLGTANSVVFRKQGR